MSQKGRTPEEQSYVKLERIQCLIEDFDENSAL